MSQRNDTDLTLERSDGGVDHEIENTDITQNAIVRETAGIGTINTNHIVEKMTVIEAIERNVKSATAFVMTLNQVVSNDIIEKDLARREEKACHIKTKSK